MLDLFVGLIGGMLIGDGNDLQANFFGEPMTHVNEPQDAATTEERNKGLRIGIALDELRRLRLLDINLNYETGEPSIFVTTSGAQFVLACRPPKSK
jgi:hypothetical protein